MYNISPVGGGGLSIPYLNFSDRCFTRNTFFIWPHKHILKIWNAKKLMWYSAVKMSENGAFLFLELHRFRFINKIFEHKIVNIFLPISINICFGWSKEPSH